MREFLAIIYSFLSFLSRGFPAPVHIVLGEDLLDDLLILVLSQDLELENLFLLHKLLLVLLEVVRLYIVSILCDHQWNVPTLVLRRSLPVD